MIKQQIIDFRKQNPETRTILGVVLGEFERKEKEKDRTIGEITDAEAVVIIKKLIDSNIQCNELEENKILEKFIPQQLTDEQIESIIRRERFDSIKDCMQFFKESYAGLYNGKTVSKIFNQK
jgi:uncharacterized protein YqeY